ncbi:hypothetical protein JW998_07830, partial [candidate division KSB1 bacterium]|nr:hypothetical protein [candidate division KSB1 bacterium]
PFQFPNYASHDFPGSDFKLVSLGQQTISVTSGGITGTTAPITVTGPNRIEIRQIVAEAATVSRGQTQIPVRMDVYNAATVPFENYTAELTFRSGADDKTSDYFVPVASGSIAAQGQRAIAFLVNVNANATLGDITLDGKINGYYNGTEYAQAPNANITDAWAVQRPAVVQIRSAQVTPDTISKGSSSNAILLSLINNGGQANSAAASIQNISFTFTNQTGTNVSSFFPVTASPQNPNSIAGDDTVDFNFIFAANAGAPEGAILVSARIDYQDGNSAAAQSTSRANLDTFQVINTARLSIVSIKSEKSTVTRGQTQPPFPVRMAVQNEGQSSLTINFDNAKTYIKIEKGGDKIIPDTWPSTLASGRLYITAGQTDTLEFWLNKILNTVPAGDYTIFGRVETSNGISSTSEGSGGVYGQLRVQEPDDVEIHQVIPTVATATVNDDTRPWHVKVVLRNAGGSDVMIDYATSNLVGLAAKGFQVDIPYMVSGDAILSGGELDTLIFPITRTGAPSGRVTIDASIQFRVLNTNQSKSVLASDTGEQSYVTLQDEAMLAIRRVRSSVSAVSVGQTPAGWTVAVHVENSGGAALDIDFANQSQTFISFFKGGAEYNSFAIQRPDRLAGSGGVVLAGGRQDSLVFRITSHTADVGAYDIHAAVKAIETNRNKEFIAVTTPSTIGMVRVVDAAAITYQAGTLEPTTVVPNRPINFQLMVTNSGGADVVLDPDATRFKLDGGSQIYEARLDGASTIPGNDNLLLQFEEKFLTATFPTGVYAPTVRLVGLENGQPFDRLLNLGGETVIVGEAGGISIVELRPSVTTVTQGQTREWTIDVVVINNSPQRLTLQDYSLTFNEGNNDVSSYFNVPPVAAFANGRSYLNPGEQSSLPFRVVSVAANTPARPIYISSEIRMRDQADMPYSYLKIGGPVIVQTPAVLQILSFRPSQFSVTRGQTTPWTVGARVKNTGGSAVKIDPAEIELDLDGLSNTLFDVIKPATFVRSNSDTLLGGAEDSLFFQVTRVDPSLPLTIPGASDSVRLVGEIATIVLNTEEPLPPLLSRKVGIAIQDSARVRIEKLQAMIASGGSVDAGGQFYLRALVKNSGAFAAAPEPKNNDNVKKATVKVYYPEGFSFESGIDTASVFDLAPGESAWTAPIKVLTPAQVGRPGSFSAEIKEAIARNTNGPAIIDPVSPEYAPVRVTTQAPANLSMQVWADRKNLSPGSSRPWIINAAVRNDGDGVVELPQAQADVQIFDAQGNRLSDDSYVLEALGTGGQLGAQNVDTLQYKVSRTWYGSGAYRVQVSLQATPLNDTTRTLPLSDTTSVTLTSAAAVSIQETIIDTSAVKVNVDAAGVAHVNAGQSFVVSTTILNESADFFERVQIVLEPEYSKVTPPDTMEIIDLDKGERKSVQFNVVADTAENREGEPIHARILAAWMLGDQVAPGPAVDSSVVVKIYRPAKLNIVATENLAPNPQKHVSLGQEFTVRVAVKNDGSENVHNTTVRLEPVQYNRVTIAKPLLTLPGELEGGEVDSLDFVVTASGDTGRVDFKATVQDARGVNSRLMPEIASPAADDTTYAQLVTGAKLNIVKVLPSVDQISQSVRDPWYVDVVVANDGDANLEFADIAKTNLTFSKGEEIDEDYRVIAPDSLALAGNFELKAHATDTLRYDILQNGSIPGTINIGILLSGIDLNTKGSDFPLQVTASRDTTIEVISEVSVRLSSTTALTNVIDQNGFALVNRNRQFTVSAEVESSIGAVDSVIVKLTSDGNSFTGALYDTIATIVANGKGYANFEITADGTDAPGGEIREEFTAEIIPAPVVKGDTTKANINPPRTRGDRVMVRIQRPAMLSYGLQVGDRGGELVQVDTTFNVVAKMKNLGRAPIGEGMLAVTPPEGYSIMRGSVWSDSTVAKEFKWPLDQDTLDVIFTFRAPDEISSEDDTIRASFIKPLPLDLNDNTPVILGAIDSIAVVRTVETALAIQSFKIIWPEGAKDGTLSTEQTFRLEAVVRSSQNLQNRIAELVLPQLLRKYTLIATPQRVEINDENEIIHWELQAPAEPLTSTHEFKLFVSSGEPGNNYFRVDSTVTIKSVQQKATVSLQELRISPSGALFPNNEVHFTRGQTATIMANVERTGDAGLEGVGSIELDLGESGLQLQPGSNRVQYFDFEANNIREISWEVQAPGGIDGSKIEVRITADSLKDENSSESVTITKPAQSLSVYYNEGGTINFETPVFLSIDDNEIEAVSSGGQPFKVKASFTTSDVKESDIIATLSSRNSRFEIIEPEKRIPRSGSYSAVWTVNSPRESLNMSDNLIVVVKAKDLQSEQDLIDSTAIYIPVVQRTTFDVEPNISFPQELAGTYTLSTGQLFKVSAKIKHEGAKYDPNGQFRLKLIEPARFQLIDTSEKVLSVADYDNGVFPEWQLTAPNAKADTLSWFDITIDETPNDIFSKQPARVVSENIRFQVRTVDQAQLYFNGYLHDDMDSDSSSVRHGSEFTITARLDNVGDAGLLNTFSVKLIKPDDFEWAAGYDSVRSVGWPDSVLPEYKIDWRVKAPQKGTVTNPDTVFTFDLEILERPDDQYARANATLLSDSTASLRVTLETGAVKVWPYTVRTNTIVVRDTTNVPVMGLKLQNKNASGTTRSYLQRLHLSFRDKVDSLISPKPMIARLAVVSHTDSLFAETVVFDESGRVVLDFSAPTLAATAAANAALVKILGNEIDSIKIIVNILENAEMKDFKITVDSLFVVDEFNYPLDIADEAGNVLSELGYASMMVVLINKDLAKSFFNYPNPFGRADDPLTSFVYYLENDSDVKIHIYTLTGELVKTWNFTQAEYPELTTAGIHQGHAELTWDGENGMGHRVRNGVYLAYISTSDGKQAMTKIAVVR